ncbi:MAG: hypothetical protein L3J35_08800 [Bacteroidales bacterium]|nr:hypothetical protein [Bacteroidales bacterium]
MASKLKVIESNRVIGGYSLSVRDNWVYKIKKVHLSETEKDKYLEDFGEVIITFEEFFEWYKSLKKQTKNF